MQIASKIACLWPGLPWLWYRGRWNALLGAMSFALLINLGLIVTFIWPELVTPTVRMAIWTVVATVWVTSAGIAVWGLPKLHQEDKKPDSGGLFRQAQDQYLRGDWYQAEATLLKLLKQEPRDADVLLMLASLGRHTHRISEARQRLKQLSRCEQASKWQMEIEQEHRLLDRMEAEAKEAKASQEASETNEANEVVASDVVSDVDEKADAA